MKTVKEISKITGVSIRTLRYYDEIGLLKPTLLSEAGYRLYDQEALGKLQQILFFRELEIPLMDIKEIIENPDYDKEQALFAQKTLLEKKRNRVDGIIELISDVMGGANTMSFEAFNDEDAKKMLGNLQKSLSKEEFEDFIKNLRYGNNENYKDSFVKSVNEHSAELIKWYGSKEKAAEAATPMPMGNIENYQKENEEIYRQLSQLKESEDMGMQRGLIARLAECYKGMFHLDNARAILLDLAKEYLHNEKLAEANDEIYGKGSSEYIAKAIQGYYGV